MTPDDFTRAFAALWGQRNADGLAALVTEDADMLTLTGAFCEGRKAIAQTLADEFAGTFARSRLVTGRAKLRPLGPGAAVLHQRFVLSGLIDDAGRDLGRLGAVLSAVLVAKPDGWQAVTLNFSAAEG